MRTVIIGTPSRLKRIRLSDLPDKNLDDSFWRWVDISRLDLRAYSMQDCDVINYKATGTKFPSCHYSQFRFPVDNTGITVPSDVSSYNHDFVLQVFRQASNASTPIVSQVADYLSSTYDASWRDGLQHLIQGSSPQAVLSALSTAVAGYPLLLSRLDEHFDRSNWGGKWRPRDISEFKIPAKEGRRTLDLNPYIPSGSFDRWALARQLELEFETQYDSDVKVWIAQLQPSPVVFASRLVDPEWWRPLWEDHG